MDFEDTNRESRKRRADDDLQREQRLSKRFDLLNLDQNGKLYIPTGSESQNALLFSNGDNQIKKVMGMDETRDRIYIHNLDEEIAQIEKAEEHSAIFLPDIEKKIGQIPESVLQQERVTTPANTQLVLYKVPRSLTLSEEKDAVSQAISEARDRARAEFLGIPRHHKDNVSQIQVDGDPTDIVESIVKPSNTQAGGQPEEIDAMQVE